MEKNKSRMGLGILIGGLVVLVLGLVAFIAYDKFIIDNNQKSGVVSQDENDNISNSNDQNLFNQLIIKDENVIGNNNNVYSLDYQYDYFRIYATINTKDVSIIVNWDNISADFKTVNKKNSETVKLSFDKKIVDIYCANVGQDINPIIVFLMSDGTVEYVDFLSYINGNSLNHNKINDVSNVVKFYSAGFRIDNSGIGDGLTILAQRSDGKFYDLYDYVLNN